MSFQEIRKLVEHLRSLGFPRLVSLENFSSPNFQLVSEVLVWLASCVGTSHSMLPSSIDTEQQRVILVTAAATFFYQTLGVQVNTKKLYGADRLAVRELLKITSVLYKATQSLPNTEVEEVPPSPTHQPYSQVSLREMRRLASSITHMAANLSDSLQHEVENKMRRTSAVNQVLDLDHVEVCMISSQHSVAALVAQVAEETKHLSLKQKELDEKILKKKESLMRRIKRLEVMKKIKPAWQTDFQGEEEELKAVWQEYVTKHIYLSYLETQLQLSPSSTHLQERESGAPDVCGAVGGAVGRPSRFIGRAAKQCEDVTSEGDESFGLSSSEDDSTLTFS